MVKMRVRFSSVLSADELLDVAFGRASKGGKGKGAKGARKSRTKKVELERVKIASSEIRGRLDSVCSEGAKLFELSGFYRELVGAMVDVQKLEGALGSLKGVSKAVAKLEREHAGLIRRSGNESEVYAHRKAFYGKVSSLVGKIDAELEFLKEAGKVLKGLPTVEDAFTVVIAGLPNVGKSSLMKAITGSEPRVESYPFTTQHVLIGHFEHRHQRVQVIDTPGLLDRSLEKRNRIERRAVLALSYLADVIIYLFDPSETCGFQVNDQVNLYGELKATFEVPIVPAVNKADILERGVVEDLKKRVGSGILTCSSTEGYGVSGLVEKVLEFKPALPF